MEKHQDLPTSYFTEYAPVSSEIKSLREAVKDKHFSDLVDDAGKLQFVDLVMEGGGMLGVALVGYVYALEEANIRFLDLAGTSAGSITALLLAAVGDKHEKKSQLLLEELASQDFSRFMDGNWGARLFSRRLLAKHFKLLRYLLGPFAAIPLRRKLGLHPGDQFESWVKGILLKYKITTNKQLYERMKKMQGIRRRNQQPLDDDDKNCRLALIAAEVTTGSKVEFPKDAELFWEDPDNVNPASFVRASMSVPFFFRPMLVPCKKFIKSRASQWGKVGVDVASFTPKHKKTGHMFLFIDGGIMSNFPINIFHRDKEPHAPTFGVRLSSRKTTGVTKINGLAKAIFDSARHTLDYDFILQHPDYQHLLAYVDTTDDQWLNFGMKREELRELFLRGVKAASTFLREFNWDSDSKDTNGKETRSYKRTREILATHRN